MRKVKFFSDPHPHEITAKWKDAPPQAGHTYELNDDEAARWVGYRRANYVDDVDQAPKPIAVDKASDPAREPEKAPEVKQDASVKADAKPVDAKPAESKPAASHQHTTAKHGQSRR
jgi:hypothetical protein